MEESKYSYRTVEGVPEKKVLDNLLELYNLIFEDAQLGFFVERIHQKEDVVSILCYDNSNFVGFKVGYKYDATTFYSWVGGVSIEHRKKGIAQFLLEEQHTVAAKKGYAKIRTKSMNRFKPMVILNLKNGFDITQVYTNDLGQTKIIFEKRL